ncbi:UDP-glycosyltransferase 89A2-like [Cucurbita moschata]|uniref:UDP-glycosyltransferase 89A2-like n=1 Tax=Cucurbita moschata TaxID=3662 RepID=A0A6J1FZE5_CUCMO|nr:UDP-glycosyltransferase 89A2-like [Cucurbita moschata]
MSSSPPLPPPSTTTPHLLVFPYPAQGHMISLLDLTHYLASHGGFTITVLVTPKNLPLLEPLLQAHPSIHTLVLPFPAHPNLPAGAEHVSQIGNHGNFPIMVALRQLHDPIVHWFNSHPAPPAAIISDSFLGWTQHLADHLQIPRIVYYSCGAFLVNVLHYSWLHIKTDLFRSSPVFHFNEIPNSPSFKKDHLPSLIKRYQDSNPDWDLLRDDALANTSGWVSVFNSFETLEGEFLEHFRDLNGEGRVFGIGPLNLIRAGDGRSSIRDSSSEVLTWLDGCADSSVLYVCFGSQKQLNQQQMEALASGLERSGARFVWVVKTFNQTVGGCNGIPIGFEDRVSDRGIVVKEWVPQVAILNHRAVGGFLSHCGWNSVLESVTAGVLILGWPMEADQFVNAKLLVDDMGVAVRVCEGANSVPDSDELGKVIAMSLRGDCPEKMKAGALKRAAVDAVRSNGSSWKDMRGFVDKLKQLPGRNF